MSSEPRVVASSGERTTWWRQPLLHFLVLGSAVFLVDLMMTREGRTIVLDASVRTEIATNLRAQLGREPDDAELEAQIEAWKRDEALYREAQKMGLSLDDAIVRAHLAGKMLEIARQGVVDREPTEEELRDHFAKHHEKYDLPIVYDLEHRFVSARHPDAFERARALLEKLRLGESAEGDPFPRGPTFIRKSPAEVGELFGAEAEQAVSTYPVGLWQLARARQGFHVLRVVRRHGGPAEFEAIRTAVRLDWQAQRREAAARALAAEIMGRYRFVTP